MSFGRSDLEKRYMNDADFHALVTAIKSMIENHGFTHSEIREAAFLAAYKYELENPNVSNVMVVDRMQDFLNTVKRGRY